MILGATGCVVAQSRRKKREGVWGTGRKSIPADWQIARWARRDLNASHQPPYWLDCQFG
jgi:hypothetical protein